MIRTLPAALVLLLNTPAEIKTSNQLIQDMHDRYASSWYSTLTFVQRTTQLQQDGTSRVGTWYEAMSLPARLRIDIDSIGINGMIFARDTQYVFREGNLVRARRYIHPLLLLGFDVYFLPVEESLNKLRGLNFDLAILREDTWQGRSAYVVGAKRDDLRSPQFWIDKERLYFVRLLQPSAQDSSLTQEIQFNKYERIAGGWISPKVIFKLNGKVVMTEEYSDIKAGIQLDPQLFDPRHWRTARWR